MNDNGKNNTVGIDNLEDWERDQILKVLQRNYDVQKTEERRMKQLSVRLQLNRMTDDEYATIRRVIHEQSGAWMHDESKRKQSDPTLELRKQLLGEKKTAAATTPTIERPAEINNNENNASENT